MPARLVAINTINAQGREEGVPVLDLPDYAAGTTVFEGLAASTGGAMNISGESQPAERFRGAYLSANTFSLLRLAPILGRDFRPEDDRAGRTCRHAARSRRLAEALRRRSGGRRAKRQGQRQSHRHHRRDAA